MTVAPVDRRSLLVGLTAFAAGVACGTGGPVNAQSPGAKPKRSGRRGREEREEPHVVPPALEVGLAPPGIDEYAVAHTVPESEVMRAIAEETRASTKWWIMMIGPVEAALLRLLVKLIPAKRVLEVGTFTGYSAIAMAEGLEAGGTIITCDISEEWTAIAKRHWAKSPHGKKIDLRMGDARDTIEGLDGPFDLVFIDADKDGYIDYWEAVIPKLAPGGIVVADNVLGFGSVVDENRRTAASVFNDHVQRDDRMQSVLLPVRDGVTVAWRA